MTAVIATKGTGPAEATILRIPTIAAEGAGEGEGVGHVIGRHLFGHQCHQGTICHLETPETEGTVQEAQKPRGPSHHHPARPCSVRGE